MRTCTHWYIQGGASSISNFIRCHCRATSRSRASPVISISLWIKSRLEISIEETFVIERKKSERLADRFRRPQGQAHQTPRTCAHEERAAGRPASVRACVRWRARISARPNASRMRARRQTILTATDLFFFHRLERGDRYSRRKSRVRERYRGTETGQQQVTRLTIRGGRNCQFSPTPALVRPPAREIDPPMYGSRGFFVSAMRPFGSVRDRGRENQ